jgi:hypothetical protein
MTTMRCRPTEPFDAQRYQSFDLFCIVGHRSDFPPLKAVRLEIGTKRFVQSGNHKKPRIRKVLARPPVSFMVLLPSVTRLRTLFDSAAIERVGD